MSRWYSKGRRGVVDVTMRLGPGIHGLLGPNGAGKTTLLEVIATAALPQQGTVHYWCSPRGDWRLGELRSRIGFLPQDPTLPPSFRVGEYLRYVAVLRGIQSRPEQRSEMGRVLSIVGLRERVRDRIRTLSGGMRQRLALARSLVGNPRLLVLDEPTSGMDPSQKVAFRDMLLQAADETTVIMSSHQTDDVAALCTTLQVLVDGRVRFAGTVGELVSRADRRVWLAAEEEPDAVCRRTAEGLFRCVGSPPPGAQVVGPTIEDAYLLLVEGP